VVLSAVVFLTTISTTLAETPRLAPEKLSYAPHQPDRVSDFSSRKLNVGNQKSATPFKVHEKTPTDGDRGTGLMA